MPDPRHASWQFLNAADPDCALAVAHRLWREGTAVRAYLLCNLAALLTTLPFMFHKVAPVFAEGTMQRLFVLVVFEPVGVAGYALLRRKA